MEAKEILKDIDNKLNNKDLNPYLRKSLEEKKRILLTDKNVNK